MVRGSIPRITREVRQFWLSDFGSGPQNHNSNLRKNLGVFLGGSLRTRGSRGRGTTPSSSPSKPETWAGPSTSPRRTRLGPRWWCAAARCEDSRSSIWSPDSSQKRQNAATSLGTLNGATTFAARFAMFHKVPVVCGFGEGEGRGEGQGADSLRFHVLSRPPRHVVQ